MFNENWKTDLVPATWDRTRPQSDYSFVFNNPVSQTVIVGLTQFEPRGYIDDTCQSDYRGDDIVIWLKDLSTGDYVTDDNNN